MALVEGADGGIFDLTADDMAAPNTVAVTQEPNRSQKHHKLQKMLKQTKLDDNDIKTAIEKHIQRIGDQITTNIADGNQVIGDG